MTSKPLLVLVGVVPLVAVAAFAFTQVGSGFMPTMDEGGFVLDYHTAPGASVAETDRLMQPRHEKKSPPNRQGQPYVKAPPRDSAQTASIFKTRSFQFLVDAVGAENIAIALESNLTRVGELMKGERFTPETAFHMETTLGLPHGFFDQPNPALAAETIARLKSPLDFIQTDDGHDVEPEALKLASALNVEQQRILEDSLSEEAQMPKKVAGGSPRAVRNSRGEMPEQPKPRAPLKADGRWLFYRSSSETQL